MMGGVHTDIDGATPLAGLYAAGETACVSINGANRLGSNSLPELPGVRRPCRAGRRGVRRQRAPDRRPRRAPGAPTRCAASSATCSARTPRHEADRRRSATRCRTTMEDAAGHLPHRTRAWPRASDTLAELQERVEHVGRRGHQPGVQHRAGGRAGAGQHARHRRVHPRSPGSQREESRGAHQRTDFPARDDERFLTHLLVHRDADGPSRVEQLPVTITRWPPGERVYGR